MQQSIEQLQSIAWGAHGQDVTVGVDELLRGHDFGEAVVAEQRLGSEV